MNYKKNRDVERKNVRSDKYQWVLLEVAVSDDHLNSFSNQNGLFHALNPFQYSEEIELLEDELLMEVMKIVNNNLTENQKNIMLMRLDGYTQTEIAKLLGIHQSSVHKSIMGNLDVKKEFGYVQKKRYGGTIHKIQKLVAGNKRIQEILQKISGLREERQ